MEAKSLQLGNLIQINGKKTLVKKLAKGKINGIIENDYSLSGVFLTRTKLEKILFKKCGIENRYKYRVALYGYFTIQEVSTGIFAMLDSNQAEFGERMMFMHQLQNAVKLITGDNLNIK